MGTSIPPTRRRTGTETTQVIELAPEAARVLNESRDRATLMLLTGDTPGAMFAVDRTTTVLGRGTDADVQLADAGLSRRHAQIVRDEQDYLIQDLGSTNGTFVNGERVVHPRRLMDGDRLQIGKDTVLRFSLQDTLEFEAAQRLYESAIRDPLTRLHNRRYLDDRLDEEFAYAARHATPLTVIVTDIDHFKRLNDTLGHQAGDAALQAVADALRTAVRAEDIVARYGGEEFVILSRGIEREGSIAFAERVRRTVEQLRIPWQPEPIQLTISLGLAHFSRQRSYPGHDALFAAADGALYAAKRNGRNRVEIDG